MENNKNLVGIHAALIGLNLDTMIRQAVLAIRAEAEKIPVFRETHNGCIRITIAPLVRDTDIWLDTGSMCDGLHGLDNENDLSWREFAYKIHPGGSYVINWVDESDGHTEPVNCYAFSALKIAALENADSETGKNDMTEHPDFYVEANGWGQYAGALMTKVYYNGVLVMKVYVCVSGAKSKEDEQCAAEGMKVVNDLLTGRGLKVVSLDNPF